METPRQESSAPEAIFEERRTSRSGFLRKFGLTLAIGLGAPLALARPAHAQNGHCCRNVACQSELPNCSPTSVYRCTDCDGTTCCACSSQWPQCITLGCGLC